MDTSKNDSLQPSRNNSKSSFINSQEDHKDGLDTFFQELANDDPNLNNKNPEHNEMIRAIIQESESLIPRKNGSSEMNRKDGKKDNAQKELSEKSCSSEKSNLSFNSRLLKRMKEANKAHEVEEKRITIVKERPIQIKKEKPMEIMKEKRIEIKKEKPIEIMKQRPIERMKGKQMEIEDFDGNDLPPEFLNFDERENNPPNMLMKAKELDNLREIGPDGKFVVPNKLLTLEEKRKRYEEIIYHFQSDSDIACLICLDGEAADDDDIFTCDLCNSPLHQSCYGSELLEIDEDDDVTNIGEWFCHRCTYLMAKDLPFTEVRCEFCPEMKGPMKRIKQRHDTHWGHIACVNWIPEIYYQHGDEKEDVFIQQYWDALSCGRKELLCVFCGILYGDCIGCDSKSEEKCDTKFHVICAQLHGLIAIWNDMENAKRADDTEYFMPIYCRRHMAREFSEEKYEYAKQVERKNEGQIDRISYLYHLPSDLENNRKRRYFEESYRKKPKRREKDRAPPSSSQRSSSRMKVKKESPSPQRKSRRLRINPDNESSSEGDERNLGVNETFIVKNKDDPSKQIERYRHVKARKSAGFVTEEEPSSLGARNNPATKSVPKEMNRQEMKPKKDPGKPIKKESPEPLVPAPVEEEKIEEKEPEKMYQFKPQLGVIMNFSDWATEKDIKEKIQKYLITHKLYNKEKQVIEIFKNEALYNIMKIESIERYELFAKFKGFLLEKNDSLPREESSYYVQYEIAAKKAREDAALEREKKEKEAAAAKIASSKQSKPEIKSQLETTLSSRYLPHAAPSVSKDVNPKPFSKPVVPPTQKNPIETMTLSKPSVSPIQKNPNETTIKPVEKPITNPTENIPNLNAKRDGSSVFKELNQGEEIYTTKKLKTATLSDSTSGEGEQTSIILSSLLGDPSSPRGKEKPEGSTKFGGLFSLVKPDYMPFRKGMKWFNLTFEFPNFVSVDDGELVSVLWPKGADMLF